MKRISFVCLFFLFVSYAHTETYKAETESFKEAIKEIKAKSKIPPIFPKEEILKDKNGILLKPLEFLYLNKDGYQLSLSSNESCIKQFKDKNKILSVKCKSRKCFPYVPYYPKTSKCIDPYCLRDSFCGQVIIEGRHKLFGYHSDDFFWIYSREDMPGTSIGWVEGNFEYEISFNKKIRGERLLEIASSILSVPLAVTDTKILTEKKIEIESFKEAIEAVKAKSKVPPNFPEKFLKDKNGILLKPLKFLYLDDEGYQLSLSSNNSCTDKNCEQASIKGFSRLSDKYNPIMSSSIKEGHILKDSLNTANLHIYFSKSYGSLSWDEKEFRYEISFDEISKERLFKIANSILLGKKNYTEITQEQY